MSNITTGSIDVDELASNDKDQQAYFFITGLSDLGWDLHKLEEYLESSRGGKFNDEFCDKYKEDLIKMQRDIHLMYEHAELLMLKQGKTMMEYAKENHEEITKGHTQI